MPAIDWSVINTALLLGALGYLWRQANLVNQVRQALLGFNGHDGLLVEVKLLRERVATLENSLGVLNISVDHLTRALDNTLRRPTSRTRRGDS